MAKEIGLGQMRGRTAAGKKGRAPKTAAGRPAAEPVEPRPGTKGTRISPLKKASCRGGDVALLRAKAAIGKLSDENANVQAGINIVLKAKTQA